jgi:hypothetical protein
MRSVALILQCALASAVLGQAPPWIWATALPGSGIYMENVCASMTNGCFAHGSFSHQVLLPFDTLETNDPAGYFIVHVDTLGNATWASQFGDPVVSMYALESGGVSCMILYEGQTTVDGQALMGSATGYSAAVAQFDGSGALQDLVNLPGFVDGNTSDAPKLHHAAGGGIAVTANIQDSLTVLGTWLVGDGVAVAGLSPQGELLWAQALIDFTTTIGSIHIEGSGRVLTCALAGLGDEAEVLSFNANGTLEWALPIALGWGILDPPVLATKPNGHALVGSAYYTQGPIGAGTILTVLEADIQGNVLWSTSTSNATNWGNDIRSLSAVEAGEVLVGGYLVGNLTFGNFTLTGNGPGGFVASIDPSGVWQWGVTETSGNVFGMTAASGTNTRIYSTGSAETGALFGSHHVPMAVGSFTGFVACLGDVALNAQEPATEASSLEVWPNPASDILHVHTLHRSPIRILDAQGRVVHGSQGHVGVNSVDIHDLKPGLYVITTEQSFIRFMKE